MKGKKNDFSVSFWYCKRKVLFLEYVHDTKKAIDWAKSKSIKFTHINIYDRRTRIYLRREYIVDKTNLIELLKKEDKTI